MSYTCEQRSSNSITPLSISINGHAGIIFQCFQKSCQLVFCEVFIKITVRLFNTSAP